MLISGDGAEQVKLAEVPSIKLLWDGVLAEHVRRRFELLKEHLTPPSLKEDQ